MVKNSLNSTNYDGITSNEKVSINTHKAINQDLCGQVKSIEAGNVELELLTTSDMVADDMGLVHGGFIFSAADYVAMVAVNENNVVLASSECKFLSPVKVGDKVHFIARVRDREGCKSNVEVEGYVLDIKVFTGLFKTVITEKHVLTLVAEKLGQNK